MSEAESFVKQLPEEHRESAKNMMRELSDLSTVSNPKRFYSKAFQFAQFMEEVHPQVGKALQKDIEKSWIMRGSSDLLGYKPSGTQIWNYFSNPFGVFNYVAQQYPAVSMGLNLVRTAIEEDGFFLVAAKGVSEKRLLTVYQQLQDLNLDYIRVELATHLMLFGNAWINPIFKKGTLTKLDLLFPNRMLPLFDRVTEDIREWEYLKGRQRLTFDKDSLLHLMLPALDNNQIGQPPLVAGITRIETSLYAMNLNNMLMLKGGMIGHLVSLEPPANSNVNVSDWVDMIQKQFNYLYSGVQTAHQAVAMAGVKNVFPMAKIGELDANWKYGDTRTDKIVAMLMGIPSEMIGVPRSESAQYQPELVENVVNAQFDSTINRFTRKIDRFFNKYVLRELMGVTDIKIVPSGRYGALTLSAAQTLKILADVGGIITINEGREKILGWEPCHPEDARGQRILDNSAVRSIKEGDQLLPELFAPEHVDPELESEKAFLLNLDKISNESKFKLKVGGRNDGEFYKGNQKIKPRRIKKEQDSNLS